MSIDDESESLERLEFLLSRKATEGLTAAEDAEVVRLLRYFPGYDVEAFERAAAASDIAFHASKSQEKMPADVRRRLVAQGERWIESRFQRSVQPPRMTLPSRQRQDDHAVERLPAVGHRLVNQGFVSDRENPIPTNVTCERPDAWTTLRLYSGWIVAACLMFFVLTWMTVGDAVAPGGSLSLSEKRAALIALPGTIVARWAVGPTPMSTQGPLDQPLGDVVWSMESQEGYMSFQGLPVNDPNVEQYQLWIIDPSRDKHPIDGGVFDIVANGTSIIPIDAKLGVVSPQAFAITVEKPGGVVVSDQKRLPLIATLPQSS